MTATREEVIEAARSYLIEQQADILESFLNGTAAEFTEEQYGQMLNFFHNEETGEYFGGAMPEEYASAIAEDEEKIHPWYDFLFHSEYAVSIHESVYALCEELGIVVARGVNDTEELPVYYFSHEADFDGEFYCTDAPDGFFYFCPVTITYVDNESSEPVPDPVTFYAISDDGETPHPYMMSSAYVPPDVPNEYFVCWSIQSGDIFEESEITSTAEYVTPNVRIKYYTDHGTAPGIKIAYSDIYEHWTITADELPELTADGYVFKGWADESGNIVEPGDAMIGASLNLYAVWEEATVFATITYHSTQGTAPEPVEVQLDDYGEYPLSSYELPTLTAEGYEFKGWAFEGMAYVIAPDESFISGDTDLYALWDVPETAKTDFWNGVAAGLCSAGAPDFLEATDFGAGYLTGCKLRALRPYWQTLFSGTLETGEANSDGFYDPGIACPGFIDAPAGTPMRLTLDGESRVYAIQKGADFSMTSAGNHYLYYPEYNEEMPQYDERFEDDGFGMLAWAVSGDTVVLILRTTGKHTVKLERMMKEESQ